MVCHTALPVYRILFVIALEKTCTLTYIPTRRFEKKKKTVMPNFGQAAVVQTNTKLPRNTVVAAPPARPSETPCWGCLVNLLLRPGTSGVFRGGGLKKKVIGRLQIDTPHEHQWMLPIPDQNSRMLTFHIIHPGPNEATPPVVTPPPPFAARPGDLAEIMLQPTFWPRFHKQRGNIFPQQEEW